MKLTKIVAILLIVGGSLAGCTASGSIDVHKDLRAVKSANTTTTSAMQTSTTQQK